MKTLRSFVLTFCLAIVQATVVSAGDGIIYSGNPPPPPPTRPTTTARMCGNEASDTDSNISETAVIEAVTKAALNTVRAILSLF